MYNLRNGDHLPTYREQYFSGAMFINQLRQFTYDNTINNTIKGALCPFFS